MSALIFNVSHNVKREEIRKLKAVIFQIEKDGVEGKQWKGKTGIAMLRSIKGYADFAIMVNPDKHKELQQRATVLLNKYSKTLVKQTASPLKNEKASFINRVLGIFKK